MEWNKKSAVGNQTDAIDTGRWGWDGDGLHRRSPPNQPECQCLAAGLDVKDVKYVINFDMPLHLEEYVRRRRPQAAPPGDLPGLRADPPPHRQPL